VLRALEHTRGLSVVESIAKALPPHLEQGIRYGTIIAASWYPIAWYRDLFKAVVSTTGDGERIVREVGRETARIDMTGIYKMAFKLLSPQALFDLSSRLFSNYYDTGKVAIIDARSGFVHACWSGCTGFDHNLWLDVAASCEMYLELSGAKHVRTRILSGAGPEDDGMAVQAHWT
jgi:hypothetical protein